MHGPFSLHQEASKQGPSEAQALGGGVQGDTVPLPGGPGAEPPGREAQRAD